MTSNELSFVCLAEVVVTSHLLQRELHRWRYSSLPRVSLHSASFRSTAFLCDTILMEKEFLHSPNSPNWIAPDTPVPGICNDSVLINLTTRLLPPKKRLTDYFQPTKGSQREECLIFCSSIILIPLITQQHNDCGPFYTAAFAGYVRRYGSCLPLYCWKVTQSTKLGPYF